MALLLSLYQVQYIHTAVEQPSGNSLDSSVCLLISHNVGHPGKAYPHSGSVLIPETLLYLRTVRKTGAFELLGKKSAVEDFQPFQNRSLVIGTLKGTAGNAIDLIRFKACTKHIINGKGGNK